MRSPNNCMRMRDLDAAVSNLQGALLLVKRLRQHLETLLMEMDRADAADRLVARADVIADETPAAQADAIPWLH